MLILFLAWGFYFFLHSFLALVTVKRWVTNLFGCRQKDYRLAYNLFNIISFFILSYILYKTPSPVLYKISQVTNAAAVLTSFSGIIIMFLAGKNYNLPAFFGLKQETCMPLQVKGIHQYMRHPLYSGTLLLVLGTCIAFPQIKNWMIFFLMFIYILIGIVFEEKKLIDSFGDEYRNYQKKVKQLIPHIL